LQDKQKGGFVMKKLVIVRHGDYGLDRCLNEFGKKNINNLAKQLKRRINSDSLMILSSPLERAKESAEIIAANFKVSFKENRILCSGGGYSENFPGLLKLIRNLQYDVDVLILVTHFEYTEGFPSYFGQQELGVNFLTRGISKGKAWEIDCVKKNIALIG
jgi:phosphohistidine phosphatase SixA